MKSPVILTSFLLALPLTGGAQQEAEPAPAGALPGEISQSEAIGTQPGPDRTLPKTQNPYGMDSNALAEGRRLFVWYNCYGCHGGRGGGGMGPSLRDATWLYGFSDQAIFNSIADGRRYGMPAWGTKLPAEQIWKITAYIKSMGTEFEPKAPPPNPVYPEPPPRRDIPRQQERKGAD
ncbi:c-type cytochrome [Modicisalibacter luteus]|uniref:C-type cytochrome n=2 Tax=Modicisalibacter luteus TaxID=453962 RepID=A0ABV7M365_9GAMM|nr:c-type cytochrome [Halomonas lutea]GHB12622.1 cytochrome c [Halomonas lutea]